MNVGRICLVCLEPHEEVLRWRIAGGSAGAGDIVERQSRTPLRRLRLIAGGKTCRQKRCQDLQRQDCWTCRQEADKQIHALLKGLSI